MFYKLYYENKITKDQNKVTRIATTKPHKYPNKRQITEGSSSNKVGGITRYTLSDFRESACFYNISISFLCWLYLCSVNCLYSPFFKFWHYVLSLDCDFENTSEIIWKLMLHGRIFMIFSQLPLFSVCS